MTAKWEINELWIILVVGKYNLLKHGMGWDGMG